MTQIAPIRVTPRDLERLSRVIELYGGGRNAAACEALEGELLRARIIDSDEAPPDVVTMNSRVRFEDLDSGEILELTLVYPQNADIDCGRVSVLAPIGTALLGLGVGESIEWTLPAGRHHIRVLAVSRGEL